MKTTQKKKDVTPVLPSPRPDRMNPCEHPKLRIEGVSFYYGKGTPFETKALDDVSLDIRAGVLTGIIGHTGSGKSTMIQMLNGLSVPTSGKIYLDGYDINSTAQDVQAEWREKPEYANLSKSAAKSNRHTQKFTIYQLKY